MKYNMPYKSEAQRKYMHANLPEIAKRWDAESRKKYKISVDNKLKGSLGEMDTKTNHIKINVKAHKGDRAELASTIKHELMHVNKPKATEKEVYKATRKTKISPSEQSKLIAKLGSGKFKTGELISDMNTIKRKVNNSQPTKRDIAIIGMA